MINEFYKNIKNFKNDDNISSDDINKKTRVLNNTSRVYNNLLKRYKDEYFEKCKQYNEEWEKKYDYKNFNDLTGDNILNIGLSWMHNPQLYDKIRRDVADRYNKDKKSNELKSIQTFLDNISNEFIKNKEDALKEFKTIKNNIKSKNLEDIVKELELAIFGYDEDDDDDEEPKYEENIAERTKMRRQNKKTASRTFSPPDPDSDNLNQWIVYDKEGFDLNGYNINGIKRNGCDKDGYNINGYDNFGYDKDGYNINGSDFSGLDRDGYNINGVKGAYDYKDKYVYSRYGYNGYGFNRNGFNRNGYNKDGFDKDGYNKYSYNKYGFNKYGFNRIGLNENRLNKYGKTNVPGPRLKILTPQQMLAGLPILLAQIKAVNNSIELKNEIR